MRSYLRTTLVVEPAGAEIVVAARAEEAREAVRTVAVWLEGADRSAESVVWLAAVVELEESEE